MPPPSPPPRPHPSDPYCLHLHQADSRYAQSSAAIRRRWLCCAWERRRRTTRAMPWRMKGQIAATSRCPPHRLSSHAPSLRTPKRSIAGFFLRLRKRCRDRRTKTPVVLVLVNGGIVAIDEYVSQAAAVVEAFLPALQAPTLAAALYGKVNRWGKLYSPNVVQIVKRSTQGGLMVGGCAGR